MKRVFGKVEVVFDIFYIVSALAIGFAIMIFKPHDILYILSGITAFVLVGGDTFHLVPRIIVVIKRFEEGGRIALGRGKQITSITMTIFYLLLWQIGLIVFSPEDINMWSYLIYILAFVRILLCLLPQNKWVERYPPVNWGIYRNIPFFLQGVVVSGLFYFYRNIELEISLMWLAIILSFLFYFPVVLWANKNPRIGMLMLPKTCTYLWILVMLLML